MGLVRPKRMPHLQGTSTMDVKGERSSGAGGQILYEGCFFWYLPIPFSFLVFMIKAILTSLFWLLGTC